MLDRRRFLLAVSVAAVSFGIPIGPIKAAIGLHGGLGTSFNGGKSQVNFNFIESGGEYPFLNLVNAAQDFQFADSGQANFLSPVTPSLRDANGYPITCQANGYFSVCFAPPTTVRPGNYVFRWTGGDSTTVIRGIPGATLVSGGLTGPNGRFVFTPAASSTPTTLTFGVTTISATSGAYINSIAIMHVNDEAAWLAGELFGTQFKSVLRQGGFGVYRFLDWQDANTTNLTTWATRRPQTYFTFADQEYRASLWAGQTTHSTSYDYAINFGSGVATDKLTIQLQFDQNSTYTSSAVTFTPGTPGTVNWTAHGLSNGDPVGFTAAGYPATISPGQNYYVVNAATNTFQIALTSGGSAIAIGSGGSGVTGSRLCTLNLNSEGAIPIKDFSGQPTTGITAGGTGPVSIVGSAQPIITTLVYDADLNSWIKNGDVNGSGGLSNGAPYEVMLQLCKEMGAHPWFSAPMLAVDPMTDFHTQLGTLCKATMPSWMIPRFEACNELWNFANWQTNYACNKAYIHWNTQFSAGQFDYSDWQGKTCSTIGQAVNASYGGSVGANYQVVNGQWTSQFPASGANGFGPRLTAANYVSQSQGAQSGYTKSAASNWTTHVCAANYFNPTERGTGQETTDASTFAGEAAQIVGSVAGGALTVASVGSNFGGVGTLAIGQTIFDQYGLIPSGVTITGGSGSSWTISNSSITIASGSIIYAMSTAATALATSYADTCAGAASSANGGNLAQVKNYFQNIFGWAATFTNNAGNTLGGTFYEGGYSSDLSSTNQINFFRFMSKFSTDVGLLITGGTLANSDFVAGNYNDCTSAGGLFPSLFDLGGTNNIWSALDPDVYASPTSAQWSAIAAYH